MADRTRIGDLLVAAGYITDEQVQKALASQRASGRRLGEELVALGFIGEVQVTQMISNQLSVPWVSLFHVEFSRELLNLLPAEIAERFCAIPIYIRKNRRDGETLYVALDDPTNEDALNYIRDASGLPVKAMVAPPSEIRDAIDVYYFGKPPRSQSKVVRDDEAAPKTMKRPGVSESTQGAERAASAARAPAPPEPPQASSSGHVEAARDDEANAELLQAAASSRPAKERPGGPKMMTLTLLDGTTVRLPAPGSGKKGGEERSPAAGLTAADLVQALRARAQGKDMSEVLPDDHWEPLVAALVSLLVKKGLIADWEFVDEWRKHRR